MDTQAKISETKVIQSKSLFDHFVEEVARSPVVKEVLVVEGEKGPVIWIIVDHPPFDLQAADPVFHALGNMFRKSPPDFFFDFRTLNISEYSSKDETYQFVPRKAKSIWQRQLGIKKSMQAGYCRHWLMTISSYMTGA